MTRVSALPFCVTLALVSAVCVCPANAGKARADDAPKADRALHGSAMAAVIEANDGAVPATGKELWYALSKIGKFAQLPVVFSGVRLDSGISNPRVVIAPIPGANSGDVTDTSLNGRLYLAANMEKTANGDPRVTSVEFISWNTLRRAFDFGVIEDMGTDEPKLRVVDGGRCFACHKNRGPILSAGPWSNTTNVPHLRTMVSERLNIVSVVPPAPLGAKLRDRIDGMALVAPEAAAVDDSVRAGGMLKLNRERFRLMNRSEGGRKAFVGLLGAIVHPGPLDPNTHSGKQAVELWAYESDRSYIKFTADWLVLAKATNHGILADYSPVKTGEWETKPLQPIPPAPPSVAIVGAASGSTTPTGGASSSPYGGGGTVTKKPPAGTKTNPVTKQMEAEAKAYEQQRLAVVWHNDTVLKARAEKTCAFVLYDMARTAGMPLPSAFQPSNPKAFVQPAPKVTQKPSGMVNPVLLATTLGLTEGDRKFMAGALADAAKRLTKQKVTASALAKQVFEGPEFVDVLAGAPLPDRDDFKDRFVAGLNTVLTTKHKLTDGFSPERDTYASGPRRDPKALEEIEAAIVPTSACLRCHDVRDGGKAKLFEPIPPLAFDPLDKQARANWVKTADPKRKQAVLARLMERMYTDADMPPQDAPEYDAFRTKQAAAFADLKQFLEGELEKSEKPKKP